MIKYPDLAFKQFKNEDPCEWKRNPNLVKIDGANWPYSAFI